MLHPIDAPRCAPQLYELTELARLTLAFATQHDITTLVHVKVPDPPFRYRHSVAENVTDVSEGLVNRVWGEYCEFMKNHGREDAGKWLFEQYSTVTTPVVELIKIPLSQKQTPDIAQLFADDVELLDQLAKTQNNLSAFPHFHYQNAAIDLEVDAQIKTLMRNFYEKLFRNKSRPIPGYVLGGTEDLNRNMLLQEYNYLHVCPGCDGEHESVQNEQLQTQADHFLPLSHYPFFAVHPLNLVPYCIQCNSPLVKGDKDIVKLSSAGNLNEIFHPYRPAQKYVQIAVKKESPQISLDISDCGQETARMAGFLSLFKIKSRWEGEFLQSGSDDHGDLSRVGRRVFSQLKNQIKGALKQAQNTYQQFQLNDHWLSECLNEIVAESPNEYGKMAGAMTNKAYAEWLEDESSERSQLLGKLQEYVNVFPETNHESASQLVQQHGRLALSI